MPTEEELAAKAEAEADRIAAEEAAKGKTEAEDVKSLPAWAQTVIADTRKEAGDNRVARTAAEKAASEAQALVNAINKAMNPNEDGDPTKLAEQLKAATAKSRDADVRLAVFIAATTAGANANALLDRNSFNKALEGLDPSSAEFGGKVSEAIAAALTADPTLKATRAVGASATDHGSGGSGEGSKRPTSIKEALSRAQ